MRVGWLYDDPGYIGGAELTQQAFREAAPEGVDVIDCPPHFVWEGLDRYVIHNCVTYLPQELAFKAPAFKYWHDVGTHISPSNGWSSETLGRYARPPYRPRR